LLQLFAQLQQLFAVLPGRLAVALRIKSLQQALSILV